MARKKFSLKEWDLGRMPYEVLDAQIRSWMEHYVNDIIFGKEGLDPEARFAILGEEKPRRGTYGALDIVITPTWEDSENAEVQLFRCNIARMIDVELDGEADMERLALISAALEKLSAKLSRVVKKRQREERHSLKEGLGYMEKVIAEGKPLLEAMQAADKYRAANARKRD